METLYVFDDRNYRACQDSFRGPRNREYYAGDYAIESGSVIDVRAERKVVGSCSIIRLRSRTRTHFRRSWTHIREDAADVVILCFVKRGRIALSHPCGETIAQAGDFLLTRSTTPFSTDCQPGEDGVYELLHMSVPMHLLRRIGFYDVKTGFCVPAGSRSFLIAERILGDLFEDAGELSDSMAQGLVGAALAVMAEAIKDNALGQPQRPTLRDKRLNDVLRFIEIHLSDPNLSVARVARGCGISARYLSLLLRQYGTPFSTLVWEKRLKAAAQWLSGCKPSEVTISEVAYRVGFKCPAHFSHMFKREFNVTPRQYRGIGTAAAGAPAVQVDGGESRH